MTAAPADVLQAALADLTLSSKNGSSSPAVLDKKNLKLAIETFSDYNADRRTLGVAYAYLASTLLGSGHGEVPDSSKKREAAIQYIRSLLDSWLSETSFPELSKAFSALSAILEVDKASYDEIMQNSGMQEKVLEAGEITCTNYNIVDPLEHARVKFSLASYINQVAVPSTAFAKKLANPDNSNWLYNRFMDRKEDLKVRAAAAAALVKLRSISSPRANTTAGSVPSESSTLLLPTIPELLKLASEACMSDDSSHAQRTLQLGMETLGAATLKPSARRIISADKALLQHLLGLASTPTYQYSTAVILANLAKYPQQGDADDRLKASLRRYANEEAGGEEELETREEMDERTSMLLQMGIMPVLVIHSRAQSTAVQRLCALIILGMVESVSHRGMVIQQGGAKALLEIIVKSSICKTPDSPAKEDYVAVQALAKILITANPLLVLGPTPGSPLLIAAIKPLASPIIHDNSSLLQQFESLMALTNIASLSEELQERLSSMPQFLDKLESTILESDTSSGGTMCRRAATELLCNLASCETTFLRYTAIDKEKELKDGQLPNAVASRIGISLALSDAEDPPTRQAALGALATFTLAPTVARYLSASTERYSRLLSYLSDEEQDEGMQLRAIECIKNIAIASSSRTTEIEDDLRLRLHTTRSAGITAALREALDSLSSLLRRA